MVAVNYWANFTVGRASFHALSLLRGIKWPRGYYEDRHRDLNAALLQTELWFDLYQQLSGVVFGPVGALGDAQTPLWVQQPKKDYGAGLRFAVD